MMELSNPEQADILHIQEQLKTALHNHQLVVLELKLDGENAELKKKLADLQRYIMYLGVSQKRLLQELRKKLSNVEDDNDNRNVFSKEGNQKRHNTNSNKINKCESSNLETINYKNADELSNMELRESRSTPTSEGASDSEVTNQESSQENGIRKVGVMMGKVKSCTEETPRKRQRVLEQTPDTSPIVSRSVTPEPSQSPNNRTPHSSPRSSPAIRENKPVIFRSSLLTRSSRLLADSMEMRIPSPTLRSSDSPEPLEAPGGSVEAALSPGGSDQERKIIFLSCIELVSHERAAEISALQFERKLQISAMNPFLMLSGQDSQKRRKEAYLPCNNSDESSDEHDSSPCPSDSKAQSDSASENGEQDQLFTEHQLDTLFSTEQHQHNFLIEDDAADSQVLIEKRDLLSRVYNELAIEKELLEVRKETLEEAIQKQKEAHVKLLGGEKLVRQSIERLKEFVAFFRYSSVELALRAQKY